MILIHVIPAPQLKMAKWHTYFDNIDLDDWSILGFHQAWIHEHREDLRKLTYQKANDSITKSLRLLINNCKDKEKVQEAAKLLTNKASTFLNDGMCAHPFYPDITEWC